MTPLLNQLANGNEGGGLIESSDDGKLHLHQRSRLLEGRAQITGFR